MSTAEMTDHERFARWLALGDSGLSSKAIAFKMCGIDAGDSWDRKFHPSDPSDFGRCFRLLKLYPEWRNRLGEMATVSKCWRALVKRWDEIEALYLEELPGKRAPKTYELMKSITDPIEFPNHGVR